MVQVFPTDARSRASRSATHRGYQLSATYNPTPHTPPPYSGSLDPTIFVYKLILYLTPLTTSVDPTPDRDKIIYASSFLEGGAMEWFLALLEENKQIVISRRLAMKGARAVGETVDELEYYLTGYEFVSDELRSFKAFCRALRSRFGLAHAHAGLKGEWSREDTLLD